VATLPDLATTGDPRALAREAAAVLADALWRGQALHRTGERARHRELLEEAIALANRALAGLEQESGSERAMASARTVLLKAHAARARDARHGAGQLSLGAQRAPTRADCDDGWRRVEEIVAVAERSAGAAARLAPLLGTKTATVAAHAAEAAARDARRLVEERNHAYTFHANPRFSFGEGWYLGAAAVLDGVAIQIEPDQPQTEPAERFLRDASLGPQLVPYRSRPRANKHLPEIVARVFRDDPRSAQHKLRAAFLGGVNVAPAVAAWIDVRLARVAAQRKVLLWIRHGTHHPRRNTIHAELIELARRALAAELVPVLVGDAVRGEVPAGAVDLTLFWKDPVFQGPDMRHAQLQFFEHLRSAHGLVGQVGVTTAGMDGPALLGLPTMYLTDAPNPRLGTWVGAVPGYEEIVRTPGYLDRVSDGLGRWTRAHTEGAG
jgi:hypothetical protein